MTFLATTRVAVLRGTTVDDLGDEVETETVVPSLADMPASFIERSRSVYDPATATRRIVRVITCRLPMAVGHPSTGEVTPVVIQDGDRIKDLVTGRIYAVDATTTVARNLAGQSSLTLDLRATASV